MAADTGDPSTEARRRVRAARRALDPADAAGAAQAVADRLGPWITQRWARARVGGYVASDGELDPGPLTRQLRAAGHSVWLPVCEGDTLRFREWDGDAPLVEGRWGILEPGAGPTVDGPELDVILVPLVAFDLDGNRLGRGAGFYDRAFAGDRRGVLVGLAHDLQELPRWDPEVWDVPLDVVATPTRLLTPSA